MSAEVDGIDRSVTIDCNRLGLRSNPFDYLNLSARHAGELRPERLFGAARLTPSGPPSAKPSGVSRRCAALSNSLIFCREYDSMAWPE
jgi:hypothetical protein